MTRTCKANPEMSCNVGGSTHCAAAGSIPARSASDFMLARIHNLRLALGLSYAEILDLARLVSGHVELMRLEDLVAVDLYELESELLAIEYERRVNPLKV